MKVFLLFACVLGTVLCAPQNYMEFDFRHASAQAVQAAPAGVPMGSLELILPVDARGRPVAGAAQGFVKQEIYQGPGKESLEILHPFGFAPPAPVVPVVQVVAVPAAPPARRRKTDDDDEEEEE